MNAKKLTPAIVTLGAIDHIIEGEYDEGEILAGAKLILALNGTPRPVIVKRVGVRDYCPVYKLISGEFMYACALKAREMDSIVGATIDAYVVDESNEKEIMAMLTLIGMN
jgi:hypothetical protein